MGGIEEDVFTLWHGLFAVTPTNTDAIDEISLFSFVSQAASLVGS